MISCIVDKPIIAYVPLNVTSFLSWILPMLSWFYVQDNYLSCQRTILVSIFIHRKPMTPKKYISIAKSLTNTQHVELEPGLIRVN